MEQDRILLADYKRLPKVELHRHLEGSLRLDTLYELAGNGRVALPDGADLRSLVQMRENEPFTFQNFLSKFQTLRQFYLSKEIIERVAYEAVADAAADHVLYMELIFTPAALSRIRGFEIGDVMDWVIEAVGEASKAEGITVGLVASVNRNEPVELAEEVAKLAAQRVADGILGLNLAGNEAEFPAEPFYGVFDRAEADGLSISIHAGEWNGPENVREAIQRLHAERIGHGVRVLEDPAVVELARRYQIPFEVCITSNVQTGVVPFLQAHPLNRMIDAGLQVVLATDDPSISNITLGGEYYLAGEHFGWGVERLKQSIITAANASFLAPETKAQLTLQIEQEFTVRES
jgi:adenosine deaminase